MRYAFVASHRDSFDRFVRESTGSRDAKFRFPEHVCFNRFSSILSGAWALTNSIHRRLPP
eukprot:gene7480-5061_t